MAQLNAMLVVLLLAAGLGVVNAQHQARKLFQEMEREQERARQLEIEWGQLQLEQSTWAAHARIEKIAVDRLRMAAPAMSRIVPLGLPAAEDGR